MKLIFASNNKGKISEIKQLLASNYELLSLAEVGITEDIPEPYFTFKENAYAKANYVFQKTGLNCFAEDSGIIAEALVDKPGVWSARFAGVHGNDNVNNEKLLSELLHQSNRNAYYKAVMCLILNGDIFYFEGKCEGRIALYPTGTNGFGYDPLFIPHGFDKTFGELPYDIKHLLSHRAQAVNAMLDFLNSL